MYTTYKPIDSIFPRRSRRAFLNLCMALAVTERAGAQPAEGPITPVGVAAAPDLSYRELALDGQHGNRRALVLSPAHGPPGATYPGLLLFHGLGEANDAELGMHAWRTSYGLSESYSRLRRAPLALSAEQASFILKPQLDALNAALAAKPFTGMVVICPVTPNPRRQGDSAHVLDGYSEWIEHTLLPAARAQAPLDAGRGIGVDGCSLGGYVAAEVFARKPELFRSFGVVQPAFGEFRVARYAGHLARALRSKSLSGIHLQTSTGDPYREATRALGRQLERLDARFTLDVLPGPHDQRWLRATGTLAMLAWHHLTLG